MYAVVEFACSDDESSSEVAIVPLIWLTKQEKRCYWPYKIGKDIDFVDFIKTKPPHKTTWPTYKIYQIHLKTDDYEEAETFVGNLIKELNDGHSTTQSSRSICRKILEEEKHIETTESNASTITIVPSPSSSLISSGFEDTLLQEITKLSAMVDQHTLMLNELLRNSRSQASAALIPPANLPKFPLTNKIEFDNFEKNLKEDESFKTYMISRLSAVGGSGLEGLTRRILKFLLNDQLANLFNWKGRGEKTPFCETTTMEIILEAAKSHFPSQERSDFQINNTVKDWLKYANSRLNHRRHNK